MTQPSSSPLTLSVDLNAVSISPDHLDNLAAEYYGVVALPSGGPSEQSAELIVEFWDESHEMGRVVASDNREAFTKALTSYLKATA